MATATLLPQPRFTAFDANGEPLSGGFVATFVPGGTTPKVTWQDAGETIPNSNPVVLDANGSALIYGSGTYQIMVTDSLGNQVPAYSGLSTDVFGLITNSVAVGFPAIPNIAALRAATSASLASTQGFVLGYFVAADGGEGAFVINASDTTSADNGGTIIVDASARRWYRETGGAPWSILWFGGSRNSGSDNLAAWSAMAAAAALQADGAAIAFPPGKYLFSANAGFNFPAGVVFNLNIQGYGAVLFWPNAGGGLTFNKVLAGQQVSLSGMHITTGAASGGNGILIQQTDPLNEFFQDVISDVVFRGDDNIGSGGSFYWTNCASVLNNSGTYWEAVTCYGGNASSGVFGGVGINFQGTGVGGNDGANYSIYHNITSGIFNGLSEGVVYNSFAQGLTISQSNFQNTTNGFFVPAGATGTLSQLQIIASQFACTSVQIAALTAVGNVMIAENDIFGVTGQSCIFLEGSEGYTITGNTCAVGSAVGSFGITVANNAGGFPSTITGNGINGASLGIFLDTGSSNTVVSGNAIANCTGAITDLGTNNTIIGNAGILPVTSSPAVAASPWAYTAGSRPEALYLSSSVSINSITQQDGSSVLPATVGANIPFTVQLAPHMAVSIGYTGTMSAAGSKL